MALRTTWAGHSTVLLAPTSGLAPAVSGATT